MRYNNKVLDDVICGLIKDEGLLKPKHIESFDKNINKYTCSDVRECEYKSVIGNRRYCTFYQNTILYQGD